jgi:AbrB family looped-hinge helix DNA binding protein
MNAQTRLSAKGQVVIPKAVREALGWPEGQELRVTMSGGRAVLSPATEGAERISYAEFRKRVPLYGGKAVAVEDMTTRIGDLYKDWAI